MAAVKMDGAALAGKIRVELALETQRMKEAGIQPHLAVVLEAKILPARCMCATRKRRVFRRESARV